jgi:hypothetical protein
VLRAHWPEGSISGAELAKRYREEGPFFDEEELQRIERLKRGERPPEDKWAGR